MPYLAYCVLLVIHNVPQKSQWLICAFSPQKRQPLPLSPPSYPHHGSEVNGGFQSAYTPPINGTDGIMGKKPCPPPFAHICPLASTFQFRKAQYH